MSQEPRADNNCDICRRLVHKVYVFQNRQLCNRCYREELKHAVSELAEEIDRKRGRP